MPRARNIKPAFFENEHLGGLPGDIQLLFVGLWTQADREGVLEYRIGKLRKALFGFRQDVDDEQFNRYITVLLQLDNGSMLVRQRYQNQEYLIIKNFLEHQSPHHTEKKKKYPLRKVLLEAENPNLTVKEPLEHCNSPCQNALNPDLLNPDLLNPESHQKKDIKKLTIDNDKDFRKKHFDIEMYLSDDDINMEIFLARRKDKAALRQDFNNFVKKPGNKIPDNPAPAYLQWLQNTQIRKK